MDRWITERGAEASSGQALSEKNQTKLKDVLSLLQRDVLDQVKDADLLRDALESIDQDLPADIKALLDPISKLDDHYAAVKRALKNSSLQPSLAQRRAVAKQSVKDLHSRIQTNEEMLSVLQPALESKKIRKTALEIELRALSVEIETDEKRVAELSESLEKEQEEILATLHEERQLKKKLSALSITQESDQKLLEDITKTISDVYNGVSKYLGV